MKILILFLGFLFCEIVTPFCEPASMQTTTKVLVIHKSRREFVRRPMRRYIRHKVIHKRIINRREHKGPRH